MSKWILMPDSFKGTMSSLEICQLILQLLGTLLPHGPLYLGEQVVAHTVQHMDRAAVYIRRQVLAQGGKGMYHSKNPLSFSLL